MRRGPLLLLLLALAGCGGSSEQAVTTTAAAAAPPGPGRVLYAGGDWAVVVEGAEATAFHRVSGTWRPDRSGRVKIAILGPKPGSHAVAIPQVAVEVSAAKPLVESGIWVDGEELAVKGGGLTPTRGTIYGAPAAALGTGVHRAVAYGRTGATASAVAWTFRVG